MPTSHQLWICHDDALRNISSVAQRDQPRLLPKLIVYDNPSPLCSGKMPAYMTNALLPCQEFCCDGSAVWLASTADLKTMPDPVGGKSTKQLAFEGKKIRTNCVLKRCMGRLVFYATLVVDHMHIQVYRRKS